MTVFDSWKYASIMYPAAISATIVNLWYYSIIACNPELDAWIRISKKHLFTTPFPVK